MTNFLRLFFVAASLLSFSNDKTKAVDLLSEGLERFQDSEDIIRAMFSFLCQDFNELISG